MAALALLTALGTHNIGDKCGGEQRWDVKTLTDDSVDQIDFHDNSSTIASLESLNPPKWGTKLPRQQKETRVYTIECTITDFIWEGDDDLHLVLKQGGHTMVGEIPDPFCPDKDDDALLHQRCEDRFAVAHFHEHEVRVAGDEREAHRGEGVLHLRALDEGEFARFRLVLLVAQPCECAGLGDAVGVKGLPCLL